MRRLSCPTRPRSAGVALWHRAKGTSRQHHQRPVPIDPLTWPTHWKEQEITEFLCKRVIRSAKEEKPNYSMLASLFAKDKATLSLLLSKTFMSPALVIDIEKYLAAHVNNEKEAATKILYERTGLFDAVEAALAPRANCQKPKLVHSSSPRGRGKTQFVKSFVYKRRAEATQCGRVIVRCCDRAQHDTHGNPSPWIRRVLDGDAAGGMCELIRLHVENVTGYHQDASDYSDTPTAYARWMSETANFFAIPHDRQNVEPLIILDTCDCLTQSTASCRPLDFFCKEVPPSCGIFVIGCDAQINAHLPAFKTTTIVTDIGSLPPLSEQASLEAAKSFDPRIGDDLATLFHYWTGGVSRLFTFLMNKAAESMKKMKDKTEKIDVERIFSECQATAMSLYPLSGWFPQGYTCLLASSTKAKVKSDAVIPVNPAWEAIKGQTYNAAELDSIGSCIVIGDASSPSTCRFKVPPIAFASSPTGWGSQYAMPIVPEELLPFLSTALRKVNRVPLLSEKELKTSLLCAVYARYLLGQWEGGGSNPWVSLAKVFEGAVHPKQVSVLERYEVNLSRGMKSDDRRKLAVENAVTHFHGHASPHDACIWCREAPAQKKKKTKAFAVPLQLRSGNVKGAGKERLVLSVDFKSPEILDGNLNSFVMVNGDEISIIGWMCQTKPTRRSPNATAPSCAPTAD